MCGKTNPAEAETCQYCQARLKPVGFKQNSGAAAPSSAPSQPAPQPASGADETDWLRGLIDSDSTPEPANESDGQASQDAEEDNADWLERIRQRTQEEQDALSKIGPKPKLDAVHPQDAGSSSSASELENWLKSLEVGEGNQAPSTGSPPPPASQTTPPAAPAQNASDDDDEWLRSLTARIEANQSMESHLQTFRSGRENEPEQPPAVPADSSEIPDWLQNFRTGEASENIPTQPPAGAPSAEESAGWLKDFGQAGEGSAEVSADDLPDWAKNLTGQEDETAAPAAGAAAGDDIPEWLRELRDEPSAPEAPAEKAAPSEELPDWLSASVQPQGNAQEPEKEEEIPDWLKELQVEQPAEQTPPAGQQEPSAPTEEMPDWLKDVQPAEETPDQPAPPESLPDWMSEIPSAAGEESSPTAVETGDTPQWMSETSEKSQEKAPAPSEAGEQEIPDWLRNLQDVPAAAAGLAQAEEAGQQSETPEAESPDWLKDLGPLPASEGAGPVEPVEEAQPAAETPDWLKDLGPLPASEGAGPVELSGEAQPAAETPDWLKDFGALPGAESEPASTADSVSGWLDSLDEPKGAAAGEAAPAEDIPDWLKSIKAGTQVTEEPGASIAAQGLPEWMDNPQEIESKWEQPTSLEEIPAETISPFASSEMDALLEGVTPTENAAEPAVSEGEVEALEPAQLPTWLQAMRPVESAVSDIPATVAADDQRIEKAGPLAGLVGVLPVEELASNYRKPPVYTNKLQVSEKQHLHSNLLESILADETRVQPAAGEAAQASQTIMRLLVAALLIFLVYVPALTGFNLAVPADLTSGQPGVAQTFQSISELAPGANILLAADFEAGLYGEITTAALPVLKYLQTRQPNVIVASTVPVGPVLGELLLSQASITPVANFGFIAGGTHALKMIGAHATTDQPAPLQQVVPFPTGQGWVDNALQGIKDITGFQRILVLTDNLENARAWVEQIQPGLGPQTQILIISSAQVAPLVRTYMESGQVNGVVSGLAGGAAFEQLSQQSGPASASWTAYQLTMGAVILLIIAGALVTGFSSLLQPEKSKRKM